MALSVINDKGEQRAISDEDVRVLVSVFMTLTTEHESLWTADEYEALVEFFAVLEWAIPDGN